MKSLTENFEGGKNRVEGLNSAYNVFIESYKLNGVIREDSEFIDFSKFKEVYLSKEMNILDLIDLISHLN